MLVKANQKGYYGERIREPGRTFNYTPNDQKAFDAGEEKLPYWMDLVTVKNGSNPDQDREEKLLRLTANVEKAKDALAAAEKVAADADEVLSNAKKADKEAAQDAAMAANDAVDDAAAKLSEAEEELNAAESE